MKEGPLVQMLDRQRVQQAAADEAKKLVDATKEADETSTAAAAVCRHQRPCHFSRFVDINDLSLFNVLHPSRVPKPEEPTFDDFGVQEVRGLLEIYGKDIEKGGQRYPALLSDSTLPQYEVYKKLVWERGWGGGRKSDASHVMIRCLLMSRLMSR